MKFTANAVREMRNVQTRYEMLPCGATQFNKAVREGNVQSLSPFYSPVAESVILQLSMCELLIRCIDDPVKDWHFAFRALKAQVHVRSLLKFHGIAPYIRVIVWWNGTVEADEVAWFRSQIAPIEKKKWAVTLAAIPNILYCLAIVHGYPMFRLRAGLLGFFARKFFFKLLVFNSTSWSVAD